MLTSTDSEMGRVFLHVFMILLMLWRALKGKACLDDGHLGNQVDFQLLPHFAKGRSAVASRPTWMPAPAQSQISEYLFFLLAIGWEVRIACHKKLAGAAMKLLGL